MSSAPAPAASCAAILAAMLRRPSTVAGALLAAAAVAAALAGADAAQLSAAARPSETLQEVPLDDLKRAYLLCSSPAAGRQLNRAAIMQCSLIYEELKLRAFDGSFEKLRAWSAAQPAALDARP